VKNSVVLDPARFAKKIAGANEITIDAAITVQSIGARCMNDWGSARLELYTLESRRRP
jgi:hypothetical protein